MFGDMHQNVDTMLHLFDHTVKSVLAANNVVVVCKNYFINILKQELSTAKTYKHNLLDERSVVDRH